MLFGKHLLGANRTKQIELSSKHERFAQAKAQLPLYLAKNLAAFAQMANLPQKSENFYSICP